MPTKHCYQTENLQDFGQGNLLAMYDLVFGNEDTQNVILKIIIIIIIMIRILIIIIIIGCPSCLIGKLRKAGLSHDSQISLSPLSHDDDHNDGDDFGDDIDDDDGDDHDDIDDIDYHDDHGGQKRYQEKK